MATFKIQDMDTSPNRSQRQLLHSVMYGVKHLIDDEQDGAHFTGKTTRIMLEQFYKDLVELNDKRITSKVW